MTPRVRGALQVLVASLVWGSLGVVVRQINASPTTLAFYRVTFAALALGAVLLVTMGPAGFRPGRYLRLLALMGLFEACNWLLFLYSLTLTTVASTVLAFYTFPVFIGLLGPLIARERLEKTTIYALGLALVGLYFTAQSGDSSGSLNALGVAAAIGAGFCYALMLLFSKRIGTQLSAETITFWEIVFAFPYLLVFFVLFSPRLLTGTDLVWAIVVGVVLTAFTTALYLTGQQHIKAQYASIVAYMEPVSAAFYAAVFLREIPTVDIYVGGALILAASGLVLLQGLLRLHRQSSAEQPRQGSFPSH